MLSRWRSVMKLLSPNTARNGTHSVSAIANPESSAPATKYGGKIVECQPGVLPTEKSSETTLCTEMTSGVASPAINRYAVSKRCQWRASPRQPSASRPYAICCQRLRALSRKVARSGTSPMYQNRIETIR